MRLDAKPLSTLQHKWVFGNGYLGKFSAETRYGRILIRSSENHRIRGDCGCANGAVLIGFVFEIK
jgi:hypothetical protein